MFSAAQQNRLTGCCGSAFIPVEICSAYRRAVSQQQCTAALVRVFSMLTAQQKKLTGCVGTAFIPVPHCPVLLCKTGSQHACATAITPKEICSSHRCAGMQHQCTAALERAEKLPCCSGCSAKQAYRCAEQISIGVSAVTHCLL